MQAVMSPCGVSLGVRARWPVLPALRLCHEATPHTWESAGREGRAVGATPMDPPPPPPSPPPTAD